jgi:hypothetical protein
MKGRGGGGLLWAAIFNEEKCIHGHGRVFCAENKAFWNFRNLRRSQTLSKFDNLNRTMDCSLA